MRLDAHPYPPTFQREEGGAVFATLAVEQGDGLAWLQPQDAHMIGGFCRQLQLGAGGKLLLNEKPRCGHGFLLSAYPTERQPPRLAGSPTAALASIRRRSRWSRSALRICHSGEDW